MITVNVWTAGNPLKREYGHASIQLNSHKAAEFLKSVGSTYYISWWPAPKEENAGKFAIARPHIKNRSFENDCAAEFSLSDHRKEAQRGNVQAQKDIEEYDQAKREQRQKPLFYRQPDHQIQIPDQVNEGYGIDNRAMYLWWSAFNHSQSQFHLLNFNCSSCASIALIHGGARHFVPDLPREGLILKRNPKDVVSYATDLLQAVKNSYYCRQWAELRRSNVIKKYDLAKFWSEKEWLEASKVTGAFDHRYTSLKRIDQAVKQYNLQRQQMPVAVRVLRMDGLLTLIYQVVTERSNSKRLDALAALALQAIEEKSRMLPEYNNSQCDNADVGVREDNVGIAN